ncbi:unnamed protein product, partial [Iphiclides podalirius]
MSMGNMSVGKAASRMRAKWAVVASDRKTCVLFDADFLRVKRARERGGATLLGGGWHLRRNHLSLLDRRARIAAD